MKPTDFSRYLSDYLTRYLPAECGVSPNTVQSYSTTFVLFLLRFIKQEENLQPDKLCLKDINKNVGLSIFLHGWKRIADVTPQLAMHGCLPCTRSALKFIQYRDVKGMRVWQDILSIRFKKAKSPENGLTSLHQP